MPLVTTTFATVPDVPVNRFTFNVFGAQNGKRLVTNPAIKTSCKKGKPGKKGRLGGPAHLGTRVIPEARFSRILGFAGAFENQSGLSM